MIRLHKVLFIFLIGKGNKNSIVKYKWNYINVLKIYQVFPYIIYSIYFI